MSSSRYWELTVEVPEEASEGVTNLVWELGALGVVEEEAPGRPPRLRAFFPKTIFARALEESVREYLAGLRELGFPGAGEPSVVALANEDWAEAWRAHFRPLPVGKLLTTAHLRLAPRYARYVAPGGALVLGGVLDAEAAGVEVAVGGHGFAPRASISVEGWTTLELVRAPLHDRA